MKDTNPYPDTVSDSLWKKANTKEREWIRQHEEQHKLHKKSETPEGMVLLAERLLQAAKEPVLHENDVCFYTGDEDEI